MDLSELRSDDKDEVHSFPGEFEDTFDSEIDIENVIDD